MTAHQASTVALASYDRQQDPKNLLLMRASKPWTSRELAYLREHGRLGATELARRLGRSIPSVKSAARQHRISLRPTGERRGLVLGQLRDLPLSAEMRISLMRRREDPDEDPDVPLCPSCARRPATVRRTGLCRACHMSHLADAHRDAIAELEVQRELWREKQEAKRLRDAVTAEQACVE